MRRNVLVIQGKKIEAKQKKLQEFVQKERTSGRVEKHTSCAEIWEKMGTGRKTMIGREILGNSPMTPKEEDNLGYTNSLT